MTRRYNKPKFVRDSKLKAGKRPAFSRALIECMKNTQMTHVAVAKALQEKGVAVSANAVSKWTTGIFGPRKEALAALKELFPGFRSRRAKSRVPALAVVDLDSSIQALEVEYKEKRRKLVEAKRKELEEQLKALDKYVEG